MYGGVLGPLHSGKHSKQVAALQPHASNEASATSFSLVFLVSVLVFARVPNDVRMFTVFARVPNDVRKFVSVLVFARVPNDVRMFVSVLVFARVPNDVRMFVSTLVIMYGCLFLIATLGLQVFGCRGLAQSSFQWLSLPGCLCSCQCWPGWEILCHESFSLADVCFRVGLCTNS